MDEMSLPAGSSAIQMPASASALAVELDSDEDTTAALPTTSAARATPLRSTLQ
jgi:hypothetical protein